MALPDLDLETALWAGGHNVIVACDEAGRGPWAGPLVVGVVMVTKDDDLGAVNDSKKMTPARREELYEHVTAAVPAAAGYVSAAEIDAIGVSKALTLATQRAVAQITATGGCAPFDAALVDGPHDFARLTVPTSCIVRGDSRSMSIAAASIVAKVHRDRHMRALDRTYPGYGFADHKGYMTRGHRDAVARLGLSSEHRHTWRVPA